MIDASKKIADVKRIVFKEIVEGDRKKFEAASNLDSSAGGGARDLRFRPFDKFGPVFERLFPDKDEKGVCKGEFHRLDDGVERATEAFFHPPTNARPNEGRLANVDKYLPLNDLPSEGDGTTILLIIQRDDGSFWPTFTTDNSLESGAWNEQVMEMILGCLRANRNANVSMVGFVDFETKETYCNDK